MNASAVRASSSQADTAGLGGAELTEIERATLARMASFQNPQMKPTMWVPLRRLIEPIDRFAAGCEGKGPTAARNLILAETHRRQRACWAWEEGVWVALAIGESSAAKVGRFHLVALGYLLGGHRRLHYNADVVHVRKVADLVFGRGAYTSALEDVRSTLVSWNSGEGHLSDQLTNALVDLLLRCGSPNLEAITEQRLVAAVADYREGRTSSRRNGLFKISRVLANKGIISAPLTTNHHQRGPQAETLATVPEPWRGWALRWRRLSPP